MIELPTRRLLYAAYMKCQSISGMIWTIVWIVLGIIVLVILLRVLFGLI